MIVTASKDVCSGDITVTARFTHSDLMDIKFTDFDMAVLNTPPVNAADILQDAHLIAQRICQKEEAK